MAADDDTKAAAEQWYEEQLDTVAAERDGLAVDVERLRTAVMGLSRWDDGAPCFCSLCPETADDHEPACMAVRAALEG
jgi:hypothetical protein